MRKVFPFIVTLTTVILAIFIVLLPIGTVSAEIADGSYQVKYEMKEKSSDSTSIADGYFTSPATLTVKDGVKHIQLKVTGASMIQKLVAPSGPVDVVSESGESRTVKFRVDGDLSQPIPMEMDIVVPDLYDTTHTARAVFDVSGLPAAGKAAATSSTPSDKSDKTGTSGEPVANPPTGDGTPIALYVTLLLGSIGIFSVYKLRTARN